MSDVWTQQRVWVAGGTGFLGRVVARTLRDRGCPTVVATGRSEADLRDRQTIQRVLRDVRPTTIIHLAAVVGGIGANRAHPAEFFYDNLTMGVHLMHEAWSAGVPKFVAIGTICAYPKFTPVPFHEDELWNGYPEETNAPYGLAKKMLLVQAQAYRQQYGWNAIYLLPVNLYGPGDNLNPESSHVIPALIRKCLEAKEQRDDHIVAWGDGSPTREFLYVDDAAEGIVLAAEHYNGADPVNLGSGREISIRDLTEVVAQYTGFGGEIRWDASKPNGQPRRCLDTSRAREAFGFSARIDLEEGLRRTVEWTVEWIVAQPRTVER